MVSKSGHKYVMNDTSKKKRIVVGKRGSVSSDNVDQLTKDNDTDNSSNSDCGQQLDKRSNGQMNNPATVHSVNKNGNELKDHQWTVNDLTSFNPFVINVQVDIVAWTLFFVALFFRLWKLDYPRNIVFDELHYGRFISMYIRGIFFFDSQPPLGKQLISLAAYLGLFLNFFC